MRECATLFFMCRSVLGTLLLLAGCAAPPLPVGDPSAFVLFPQTRTDVTICPTFTMVVDINEFTLVPRDGLPADGAGHWHAFVGGTYLGSVYERWATFTIDPTAFAGGNVIARVELAEVDHDQIGVSATAEFVVGATPDCIGGREAVPVDSADSGV